MLAALRRRPAAVAFAAIAVIFVLTRLALLWRFPPFVDESLYAFWSKEIHDSDQNRFVPLANGRLPLLPWLGAVIVWLGAAPLTAVRLVSTGSGLVSLASVGWLGRRLGGTWTGVAAAGLYVVVPYFVVHDVIGIYEPLVIACAMVALCLEVRLAHEPRRRLRLARFAGGALLALAIAGAMFSILKLSEHYAILFRTADQTEAIRSVGAGLAHPLRWIEFAWPGERTHILGYVTPPLVVLAAIGLGLALRRRWPFPAFLVLWAIVPLAASALLAETIFARWTLWVAPPLAVFAAFALVRLLRAAATLPFARPLLASAGAVAVALVLLPAFILDGHVLADPNRAHYPGYSDVEYATG